MSGWSPLGLSRWGGKPVVRHCGAVEPRHRAVLIGTVVSVRSHRRAGSPCLDAVLDDGTGTVVLRWLGRRVVPGVVQGAVLRVEGTIGRHHGTLVVLNPLWEPAIDDQLSSPRSAGSAARAVAPGGGWGSDRHPHGGGGEPPDPASEASPSGSGTSS